jgi:hypothetical protein
VIDVGDSLADASVALEVLYIESTEQVEAVSNYVKIVIPDYDIIPLWESPVQVPHRP